MGDWTENKSFVQFAIRDFDLVSITFLFASTIYIYIYVLNIECSYDIILYIFMCYDNQFDLNMYHLS